MSLQWCVFLQDIDECIIKYGNYSRGPNCYKTNHWGAFHRHYQIKPEVKRDGGLLYNKRLGLHDSDYFLEINATNKALVSTILTKKVGFTTIYYYTSIWSFYISWNMSFSKDSRDRANKMSCLQGKWISYSNLLEISEFFI